MQNIFLEKKFHRSAQEYSLAILIFWRNPTTPLTMRAPFLLLTKWDDTVLSLWRSWFKCLISWMLYERRVMNLAVSGHFMWRKVHDREDIFMPDLLSLSSVLNCGEQSVRSPVLNALGNRLLQSDAVYTVYLLQRNIFISHSYQKELLRCEQRWRQPWKNEKLEQELYLQTVFVDILPT